MNISLRQNCRKMKQIEVVAAIIKKDNKVFATQRGYGEFKDMWEFPGGKMEPGETKEEALMLLIPGDSRPPIPVILGHPC